LVLVAHKQYQALEIMVLILCLVPLHLLVVVMEDTMCRQFLLALVALEGALVVKLVHKQLVLVILHQHLHLKVIMVELAMVAVGVAVAVHLMLVLMEAQLVALVAQEVLTQFLEHLLLMQVAVVEVVLVQVALLALVAVEQVQLL
jgi:hypothetical protein